MRRLSAGRLAEIRGTLSRGEVSYEDARQLNAEVTRLAAEVERMRMEYGRQRARNAVFMGVMATLASEGDARAKAWVAAADAASLSVRLEDFVVAHVNAGKP